MIPDVGRVRLAAIIAIGGISWWAATVIALHLLVGDGYDRVGQPISQMVHEGDGISIFLSAGLTVFGLGVAALGFGLLGSVRDAVIAPYLLIASGVLWVVTAFVPTGPDGGFNVEGGGVGALVHDASALLAFVIGVGCMFALARGFRRDDRWASFARPTLIWAIVALAAFIALFGAGEAAFGLTQRIFVSIWMAWLIVVAFLVLTITPAEPAVSHDDRS